MNVSLLLFTGPDVEKNKELLPQRPLPVKQCKEKMQNCCYKQESGVCHPLTHTPALFLFIRMPLCGMVPISTLWIILDLAGLAEISHYCLYKENKPRGISHPEKKSLPQLEEERK